MKKMLLTVLVAVVVGITAISYWNYTTWEGLGVAYFYYVGQSEVTLEQYNRLTSLELSNEVEVVSLTAQSVLIDYSFTTEYVVEFLPQQAVPTFWNKIRASRISSPVYSLVTVVGSVVLMTFVVFKFGKKEEGDKSVVTNQQARLELTPVVGESNLSLTRRDKILGVVALVYALGGTAVTVLALMKVIPVWLFPIPFSLVLVTVVVLNRKRLFKSA